MGWVLQQCRTREQVKVRTRVKVWGGVKVGDNRWGLPTVRQTDGQTVRQTDGQTDRHTDTHTHRLTGSQTDTHRQAGSGWALQSGRILARVVTTDESVAIKSHAECCSQ